MTPAESLLTQAAVDGFDVCLVNGKPVVRPTGDSKPNAAMMASLREHRDEIIRLLGGQPTPAPAVSKPEFEPKKCADCGSWVFEPMDNEFFCDWRRCQWKRFARGR